MWRVLRGFVEGWIYPAHSLRHYFFDRYDIVRLPKLSRTHFHDLDARMYHAVMELVRIFYEESGWEMYNWRDKTNEDGSIICGARYGMDTEKCLFPEYKGKYIIDIIKEIYDWQHDGMDRMMEAGNKIVSDDVILHNRNIMARDVKRIKKECQRDASQSASQLVNDYLASYNLDWEILDKYVDGDRAKIIDKQYDEELSDIIRKDIQLNMQKYLHLAIEVREHLAL